MKQKTVNESVLHELGLITDERKEQLDLENRAKIIARDHKDILKLHGLVTEDNKVKIKFQ